MSKNENKEGYNPLSCSFISHFHFIRYSSEPPSSPPLTCFYPPEPLKDIRPLKTIKPVRYTVNSSTYLLSICRERVVNVIALPVFCELISNMLRITEYFFLDFWIFSKFVIFEFSIGSSEQRFTYTLFVMISPYDTSLGII